MTRYQAVQLCLKELGVEFRFNKGQKLSGMFRKLDTFYGQFQASFSSKKLEEEKKELDEHLSRYADFMSIFVRPGSGKPKDDKMWYEEYRSYILGIYLEMVDVILVGSYLLSNRLISESDMVKELLIVKNKLIAYNVDEYLTRNTIDAKGVISPLIHILIKYKTYELVTAIDTAYKSRYDLINDELLRRYKNMFTVLYPEKDIQYLKNLKLIRKFIFTDNFEPLLYHIKL